jgi:hypothetical protein
MEKVIMKQYSELDDTQALYVVASHAAAFKLTKMAGLRKVFELGNPTVVITYENEIPKYTRIADQTSIRVIKLLIEQYAREIF